MQRTFLVLILSFLAFPCVTSASDDFDIKVYPVEKTRAPVAIDGLLNDPVWEKAVVATGFTYFDSPTLVEVQTFFKVAYDEKYLYLAIQCDEPLASKLPTTTAARDSTDVFASEVIELFVDPRHSHGDYFQIAVNCAGGVYDSQRKESGWDSGIVVKTRIEPTQWVLETALPWQALGVAPKPGMLIGLNVCRDRNIDNARQWTNWSQTRGGFHDPERFGHLLLSPSADALAKLSRELRKGDRRGPIVISGREVASQKSYLALAQETLAEVDVLTRELETLAHSADDGAFRDELGKLLGETQEKAKPIREKLAAASTDGGEWSRLSQELNGIRQDLSKLIWKARLRALLSEL